MLDMLLSFLNRHVINDICKINRPIGNIAYEVGFQEVEINCSFFKNLFPCDAEMCNELSHAFIKTLIAGSLDQSWIDLRRKKKFKTLCHHNLKSVVCIKFCPVAVIKKFFGIGGMDHQPAQSEF